MTKKYARKSRALHSPARSVFHEEPPAGGNSGEGGSGGSGGEGQPKGDPPKTFTQEDVTRITTRETEAARTKAAKDLSDQLGVPVDEAKSIIEAHRAKVEGEKSEAEKAREAAEKARTEAESEKQTAAREVFESRADRALVAAGVPDEDSKLARLRGMLTVKPGAKVDEVKADVTALKAEFPGLFGGEVDPKRPPAPGSDPKTGRKTPPGAKSGIELGMERAKARTAAAENHRPKPPGVRS